MIFCTYFLSRTEPNETWNEHQITHICQFSVSIRIVQLEAGRAPTDLQTVHTTTSTSTTTTAAPMLASLLGVEVFQVTNQVEAVLNGGKRMVLTNYNTTPCLDW